jgi:hypothetical protein
VLHFCDYRNTRQNLFYRGIIQMSTPRKLARSINIVSTDALDEKIEEKPKTSLLQRFVTLFPFPEFIVEDDSSLRRRWNVVVFAFALWNAFVVPLRLAFIDQHALDYWPFYLLDYISDVVFVIDIVLNFRTTVRVYLVRLLTFLVHASRNNG